MKLKAGGRSKNVVLEVEEGASLPPIALPDVNLKKILAPVDFSKCSHKALHYAVSFARQFHAEVFLLHVMEVVPVEGYIVATEAREEAAKELAEWRNEVVAQATVKAIVRDGLAAHQVIVDIADQNDVDLIVLGTQGRTGLAHLLVGSTAERVVRYAPCPVLVVREREHDFLSSEGHTATT